MREATTFEEFYTLWMSVLDRLQNLQRHRYLTVAEGAEVDALLHWKQVLEGKLHELAEHPF